MSDNPRSQSFQALSPTPSRHFSIDPSSLRHRKSHDRFQAQLEKAVPPSTVEVETQEQPPAADAEEAKDPSLGVDLEGQNPSLVGIEAVQEAAPKVPIENRRESQAGVRTSVTHVRSSRVVSSQVSQASQSGHDLAESAVHRRSHAEGQLTEPLLLNASHSLLKANGTQAHNRNTKQRVFPLFRDHRLAALSVNYALYMEFFRIVTSTVLKMLLLMFVFNLVNAKFVPYLEQDSLNLMSLTINQTCSAQAFRDTCNQFFTDISELLVTLQDVYCCTVYIMLTTLLAGVFLIHIRHKEEKKILETPIFYEFTWTQDLFSVLIENIPPETTEKDLKEFFEGLEPLAQINGKVEEVILVQDYYKCMKLREEGRILTAKVEGAKDENSKDRYTKSLKKVKQQFNEEKDKLPDHSGKAILIFDSIRTKSLVLKFFTWSFWGSFFRLLSRKKHNLKTLPLKDAPLVATSLPEPKALIFENLCYPPFRKYLRMSGIYILGFIIIVGFLYVENQFDGLKDLDEIREKQLEQLGVYGGDIPGYVSPFTFISELFGRYTLVVLLLMLENFSEWLYRKLNEFARHNSKLGIEVSCFNNAIYTSLLLYLVSQATIVSQAWSFAPDLIQATIRILCVRYVLQKVVMAFVTHKHAHSAAPHQGEHPSLLLRVIAVPLKVVLNVDLFHAEFELFEEAARAFPLLAMTFGFMDNKNTPIIDGVNADIFTYFFSSIPLNMVCAIGALMVGACCDKYRLIKQKEPCEISSAHYMLKAFKFLKFDHFCIFVGTLIWAVAFAEFYGTAVYELGLKYPAAGGQQMVWFSNLKPPNDLTSWLFYTVAITLVGYLFYVAVWPPSAPLEGRFQQRFLRNKSRIDYNSVKELFTKYETPNVSFERQGQASFQG